MAKERHVLIIFEKYKVKGEIRHKAHRVGNAVAGNDGSFALFIPPGIALSGRVVMVPPDKAKMIEIDLARAYQSAADEYGV